MANKAKTQEMRELPPDTLDTKIKDMEANLFNLRFQASQGKLENTAVLRATRKDIARAKTVLRQKSAAGAPAAPAKAKSK